MPKSVTRPPAKPRTTVKREAAQRVEVSVGTDAAFASATVPTAPKRRVLRNVSEVRHFFRTNDVPIYFVGATPFNLLGLDRWVRKFSYIAYYDAWDGAHPRVFTPKFKPYEEFGSGEDINNWLLRHPETRAYIERDTPRGVRPKVAMVFFNAETESICAELGYDLILPTAELREHLDSKIVTTKLGDEAGSPSVPNILTTVDSWEELRAAAEKAGLGDELVVQTPYGDSGKTTFFISSEADWRKYAGDIVGEDVKVMRRINNYPVAVEAVITRCGTIVGPFMTELTGYRELTPYKGGWCGNEMHPDVLTPERREKAAELVRKLGDRLGKEGYKGFFEVDVLIDTDTEEVYLGELNPRISGATSITNVTAGAYADVPLFLFHLLEFMGVDFDIDVDDINERWETLAAADTWSQMIIKETNDVVELLEATPKTGHYSLDDRGNLIFRRSALDWHQLQDESEAFFLRIYATGDYRWKGADLGILITKGRLQRERAHGGSALTIRAKHFIDSFRAQYSGTPLAAPMVDAPVYEGIRSV
ncbi:biotin carboxylase [Smaragdicoccus niigatensis]|uniref:biotin carboxylase n=1 Tax=Smaragdicoccus niigatensis TaxID=359359 RepID=UPI0003673959|nr:biotin carboxylase [Smaragdicoccus niigatensis]